jgi:hypothetical protein
MQRRGLLAGATAALAAGAAIATAAHGAPVASPAGAGDDAELIRLCAELDECEWQLEAVYAVHSEDDPPEERPLMERQVELSQRIMGMPAHSADGIVAIARSLAIQGNGIFDFDPDPAYVTGRLMTALMREVCLLSGLPAPSKLAGRMPA